MDKVPPELWQGAMNIALERLSLVGGGMLASLRRRSEAKRVLEEAKRWPLKRCVRILPYLPVNHPEAGTAGLFDDKRLKLSLAVVWLAPFPAHSVSLSFTCETEAPVVTFTVNNYKVTGTLPDGSHEYLSGMKIVTIEAVPDNPSGVSLDDLGPASLQREQTKLSRLVRISGMKISANAPWQGSCLDSEFLPAMDVWVPRWSGTW